MKSFYEVTRRQGMRTSRAHRCCGVMGWSTPVVPRTPSARPTPLAEDIVVSMISLADAGNQPRLQRP